MNSISFYYLSIAFSAISSQSDYPTRLVNVIAKNIYALIIPHLIPTYPNLK